MWAYRECIETGALTLETTPTSGEMRQTMKMRFALDDESAEYLPDSSGRLFGREPTAELSGEPRRRYTLSTAGQRWAYGFGSPFFAKVFNSEGGGPPNLRVLGAVPFKGSGAFHSYRAGSTADRIERYEVEHKANQIVVRAFAPDESLEWILDPQREMQPIAVRVFRDGKRVAQARTQYQLADGVWYPARVEYLSYSHDGDARSTEVLQLSHVNLNDPSHPKTPTPAHIGVEPGVNLEVRSAAPGAPSEVMIWSGSDIVTQEEFGAMLKSGAVSYGQKLSAVIASQKTRASGANALPPEQTTHSQPAPTLRAESQW